MKAIMISIKPKCIYFGKDDYLHFKTYDRDEYNEWLDSLKEVLPHESFNL